MKDARTEEQERAIYGGKTAAEHEADFVAGNHVSLYRREKDGLLIWRAFRAYRERGVAVPERILLKFDQWSRRLEDAAGAKAVAEAIEMTRPGGGASGAKHLVEVERRRAIVTDVQRLRDHPNFQKHPELTVRRIHERVAVTYATTASSVKTICSQWKHAARLRKMKVPPR